MTCPNKNTSGWQNLLTAVNNDEKAAMAYWILNGENTMEFASNGEPSILYQELSDIKSLSESEIIQLKLKTLTSTFKSNYQGSIDINGEPLSVNIYRNSYDDLLSPLNEDEMEEDSSNYIDDSDDIDFTPEIDHSLDDSSNEHVDDIMEYNASQGQERVVGNFQKIIEYKRQHVSAWMEKIKILNTARNHTKSMVERDKISKVIQNVKEHIAIVEEEITALSVSLNTTFANIKPYLESEISFAKELLDNPSSENLIRAGAILNFLKATSNFDTQSDENPFFTSEEMDHVSEAEKELFRNFAKQAYKYDDLLSRKLKENTEKILNNISSVKKFRPEGFSLDDLTLKNSGLKDISWIDMYVSNISNGITSDSGNFARAIRLAVDEVVQKYDAQSKQDIQKLNNLRPRLIKALKKRGSGLSSLSIGGVSFELFLRRTRDGFLAGNGIELVSRETHAYSTELKEVMNNFHEEVKKARKKYNTNLQVIESERNITYKNDLKAALKKRDDWFIENTQSVSTAKLLGVIQNEDIIKNFPELSTPENIKTAKKYTQEFIDKYGEEFYKEQVSKNITLLNNFMSDFKALIDTALLEEDVASQDELSVSTQKRLSIWHETHNPFTYSRGGSFKVDGDTYYKDYNYTSYTPSKQEHLDSKYDEIMNEEVFKEFYLLASSMTEKARNNLLESDQRLISSKGMIAIEKSFREFIASLDSSGFTYISDIIKELIRRLASKLTVGRMNNISQAEKDVITGERNYKVNNTFLHKNRTALNSFKHSQYLKFKGLTGIDLENTKHIKLSKINQEGREYLNSFIDLSSYGDNIPVARLIREYSVDYVAQDASLDLIKVLNMYSNAAALYAARNELLPTIKIMKKQFENIKQPSTNVDGEPLLKEGSKTTEKDGVRHRAIQSFDNYFKRRVLGMTLSKHSGRILKRIVKTDGEFDEYETQRVKGYVHRKISSLSNIVKNRFDKNISEVINDKTLDLTEDDITKLKDLRNDLTKDLTITSIIEGFLGYIRWLTLGFNISSGITNVLEGQISNHISAIGGDYFDYDDLNIVNYASIVRDKFLYRTFKKEPSSKVRKALLLFKYFDILQDASNELQKASVNSAISTDTILNAYYIIKKGETLNQIPLMVASLNSQMIKGVDANGKEIETNVWEALEIQDDNSIKLKEEFRSEENLQNWENANGSEFFGWRSDIGNIIEKFHGDYANSGGNVAKSTTVGKMLLMFKTWLPMEMYKRFAPEQDDIASNIKGFKGRYRSLTMTQGLTYGAAIGAVTLGLPAAAVLGGVGAFLAKVKGSDTITSSATEMLNTTKLLMRKMFSIAASPVLKVVNTTRKDGDKIKFQSMPETYAEKLFQGGVTSRDWKNYKMNMQELSVMLSMIALFIIAKGLTFDDDDDKNENQRKLHNVLSNKLMGSISNMQQYMNPHEMVKNMTSVAAFTWVKNLAKTLGSIDNLMRGDDMILQGVNAGDSRILNNLGKIVLINNNINTILDYELYKGPIHKYFIGAEKAKKKEDSILRKKLKTKLQKEIDRGELDIDEGKEIMKEFNRNIREENEELFYDEYEEEEENNQL